MTDYRYLGRWNYLLNKPIGSQGWIDEAEAQRRYETGGDFFAVVDADAGVGVAPKSSPGDAHLPSAAQS